MSGPNLDLDLNPDGTVTLTVHGRRLHLSKADLVTVLADRSRSFGLPPQWGTVTPASPPKVDLPTLAALVSSIATRGHMRTTDERDLIAAMDLYLAAIDSDVELRELDEPRAPAPALAPEEQAHKEAAVRSLTAIAAWRIPGTLRRKIDETLAALG